MCFHWAFDAQMSPSEVDVRPAQADHFAASEACVSPEQHDEKLFRSDLGRGLDEASVVLELVERGEHVRDFDRTTDGTSPGLTNGRTYTGPFNLGGCGGGGGTVEAVASAPGYRSSAVVVAVYIGEGPLPQVAFTPASLTANNDFSVLLTYGCSGTSSSICYTLDGVTQPTCDSQAHCTGASRTYDAASQLSINGSNTSAAGVVVVQALGCMAGSTSTSVASQDYVLQVAAPQMGMPAPGALPHQATGYTQTIASLTAGASIRFATDGSMPTCTSGQSPQPTAPGVTNPGLIAVSQSETINAIACKPGYAPSSVSASAYTLQ